MARTRRNKILAKKRKPADVSLAELERRAEKVRGLLARLREKAEEAIDVIGDEASLDWRMIEPAPVMAAEILAICAALDGY